MKEQGQLATTIRKRILEKAHALAEHEPVYNEAELSKVKKIEAKQLNARRDIVIEQ